MSEAKDTIYIDVDDEITAIIDKVQAAKTGIVALVLPKRAAVLQSMVNMKLLKRAAENADKNLVLITSESRLLPLAGAAGVHVAKNLQSMPEIPDVPEVNQPQDEVIEASPQEPEPQEQGAQSSSTKSDKPSGEASEKPKNKLNEPEETIDIDSEGTKPAEATGHKPKTGKKNKVPNFEKFRKRLILGSLLIIALIAAWVFAALLLPRGKITIQTNTTTVGSAFDFTADPNASELNMPERIVPAKQETVQKTDSQKVPATGKKDVGTKATGTITIKNCASGSPPSLPAGSKFTSSGGKVFVTNVAFTPNPATVGASTSCSNPMVVAGTTSVSVTAAENGDAYNIGSAGYTNSSLGEGYTLTGSDMTGGTSKLVTVVTQSDINTAKQKLANNDQAAKDELVSKLKDAGYYPLTDTFSGAKNAKITTSANVGGQAEDVTVTSDNGYTMAGIKEDDLKKLIDDNVRSSIDPSKQRVQDYGLDQAIFKITASDSGGKTTISLDDQVAIGPNINQDQLKTDLTGKKKGEAETIIRALPGVKDATVSYSPFWVTKMPKPGKVTIVIEKAN